MIAGRMAAIHTEARFEEAIERDLLASGGYTKGDPAAFDRALALFPSELFAFVEASQPELWALLRKDHGANLEQALLDAVVKNLASRGTLEVLRHGLKVFGRRVDLAFFRPAHGLNPDLEQRYQANRLSVTRQVRFDPDRNDSVDVLLSLNGLPIATLELKNSITGQTALHAKKQYADDRDPRLPLFAFKQRALVHFAVDTDEVFMTTRLAGRATYFLPFNRGNAGGKGNPTIEGEPYKTAYLWREVLERHSVLDILARFVHLVTSEEKTPEGRTLTKE